MLLLLDGTPEEIEALSADRAAVAIIEWRLSPRSITVNVGSQAAAIANHIASHHRGYRAYEFKRTILEGMSWGIANGLLFIDFGHPNHGAIAVTRLAQQLHASGKLAAWPPASGLRKEDLHSAIADAAWPSVCAGDYDVAVFKAFRALEEVVVKNVPECQGKSGMDVFSQAFNKEKGPLSDQSADVGEREAWRSLFAGAYGAFRNPPAHRSGTKADSVAVREELILASLLMRRLDAALARCWTRLQVTDAG
jgi:uncharacterized protein (TIGR02391 family)